MHYIGGEGVLSFESGENKKDILIPIMNDPNGGRSTFTVELGDVTGPAELGANEKTTVHIDNVAGERCLAHKSTFFHLFVLCNLCILSRDI